MAKIASVSRMKNRSRMVVSLAYGKLVSLYFEATGERHGDASGQKDCDSDDVMSTRPAELAAYMHDKTVQHQPSAGRDDQARQRAAPPADYADSYCHDGELGTRRDALAQTGDRHGNNESHAERDNADERIWEPWVRTADRSAVDNEGTGPAVRQRQHSVLLSNRCRIRQRIQSSSARAGWRVS
jgi:hypothetical protein